MNELFNISPHMVISQKVGAFNITAVHTSNLAQRSKSPAEKRV
jgi:hypothetical protein